MLHNARRFAKFGVMGVDGQAGKVHGFLHSDEDWRIRYLVVDTGNWFSGRKTLVRREALREPDPDARMIHVDEYRQDVLAGPDLDEAKPVCRQHEVLVHDPDPRLQRWPEADPAPGVPRDSCPNSVKDPHLRSTQHLIGYRVCIVDGQVGRLSDFVIDDEDWSIRYVVVTVSDRFKRQTVLVDPQSIRQISYATKTLFVTLDHDPTKGQAQHGPHAAVDV